MRTDPGTDSGRLRSRVASFLVSLLRRLRQRTDHLAPSADSLPVENDRVKPWHRRPWVWCLLFAVLYAGRKVTAESAACPWNIVTGATYIGFVTAEMSTHDVYQVTKADGSCYEVLLWHSGAIARPCGSMTPWLSSSLTGIACAQLSPVCTDIQSWLDFYWIAHCDQHACDYNCNPGGPCTNNLEPGCECWGAGGDTDGDGCCDSSDYDPLDPEVCFPPLPPPPPPCEYLGGDADEDGCCDDFDPDPSDPEIGCDDGPCADRGGDADGDGCCADVDQDDNDPEICNRCDNRGGDNDGDECCADEDVDDDDPEVGCECANRGGDADLDGCCADVDPDDDDPGKACECVCDWRVQEAMDKIQEKLRGWHILPREDDGLPAQWLGGPITIPIPGNDPVVLDFGYNLAAEWVPVDLTPWKDLFRALFVFLLLWHFVKAIGTVLLTW